MATRRTLRDGSTDKTRALPATASATVRTTDFDLGALGIPPENVELVIEVPALTVTELPDTRTLTVSVCSGAAATPTDKVATFPVIAGSGGTGATAKEFRFKLPSNISRFVNVEFVTGASTGDQSGKTANVYLAY